jgi:hypothetical protein
MDDGGDTNEGKPTTEILCRCTHATCVHPHRDKAEYMCMELAVLEKNNLLLAFTTIKKVSLPHINRL